MQALFHFRLLSIFPNTAVLIEAHAAQPAFLGRIAVACLAVAAGDGVWLAQCAFDVHARHTSPYLLLDDSLAPNLGRQQVAATIILFTHDSQYGFCVDLLGFWFGLLRRGLRHSGGLSRARRGIEGVLHLRGLAGQAALPSEGDVTALVNAAVYAGCMGWDGEKEQGAEAGANHRFLHDSSSLTIR